MRLNFKLYFVICFFIGFPCFYKSLLYCNNKFWTPRTPHHFWATQLSTFFHQQSPRDEYVKIVWDKILNGTEFNFDAYGEHHIKFGDFALFTTKTRIKELRRPNESFLKTFKTFFWSWFILSLNRKSCSATVLEKQKNRTLSSCISIYRFKYSRKAVYTNGSGEVYGSFN